MVEEPNKSQLSLAWKEVWVLVALSLAFRYCLSLNPFSGKNTPPMFGDMEAQRHWMEITVNLPLYDWYRNTTENDLMYWGLDYPPLTAFHEYCMGRIAKWWYPEMVELGSSRGFETDQSILFMRCSVLIADCLVYIPACVFFLRTCLRGFSYEKQRRCFLLMLFMPPLVLIDHAHFQYNAVCLGFVLLAITCVSLDWDCVGSFFFVMAIGYKQIALYYSLVFFVWLLRKCFVKGPLHLVRIGTTVVLSFALLFFPFLLHLPEDLTPVESLLHVVHRMFPWDRWLFEDKVASFWCTVNNVIKLNRLFSAERLKLLCTLLTLAACLPSLLLLWRKPSLPSALFSLFSCALSFFLFSYQVHEKTILFPLLPMVLLAPSEPEMAMVFTYFASYSMIPLYAKDHNLLMTVAIIVGFLVLVPKEDLSKGWRLLMCFSVLVFGYYAFPPPARYPDLHSVFLSAFSCFVFSLFYLVMLKKQWEAAKTV
ncbi:dolichyl pyrophosphate Man9GlcNAc2 alpha-1,3-glucosyltransferase [Blastocystis sp. ATCC 50177/Nand II]|uniref:Alpha-1,3-glucosyltransferase n=1 Tax=Blastocystis sp. subtype 1 (strain ATCC 50177 / NandII) TaxID=478820 RepID=A0A196SHW4_BLAHN|nr:dolichyl pyrophosphate Man9GlcNAc2 alpha-1,3-glucosyltransferase [Blastocystis sp. ATCC 50177/Nand II]